MGRQSLRIVIVLGILVTIVGGTGIFANITDRATAGPNDIQSAARSGEADLKIEPGNWNQLNVDCPVADLSGFVHDDTDVGQFAFTASNPGDSYDGAVCIKNAALAPVDITATVIDLADLDVACGGSELPDLTCGLDGTGAPQAGELAAHLTIDMDAVDCFNTATVYQDNPTQRLDEYTAVPLYGGAGETPLSANNAFCAHIVLAYDAATTDAEALVAQSDKVTWRFAFDGAAR